MENHPLFAISPVDGRYQSQTRGLSAYLSEFGLIKYRIKTEVEYLLALAAIPLPGYDFKALLAKEKALREVYTEFTAVQAKVIKDTEKITNHDVKAVEYFLRDELDRLDLGEFKELVHFGLTSQDINNTAIPMSIQDAQHDVLWPLLQTVIDKLAGQAESWKNVPMLARTHGQPASPTRLGKEWLVFVSRLQTQFRSLQLIALQGKFGGATGNFNAHYVAYPGVDWVDFSDSFLRERLKLKRNPVTTQIENYDELAALFDGWKRINNILVDMCRDIWSYVSHEYFSQQIKEGEVGSSAMPHKVNPIDFENAEGNLGIANALFEHLSAKLPISRMQRDLTDSTVLRNVGVPFSHTAIALNSVFKGLGKIILNEAALRHDLENNWAVTAEAIQTILRREKYPDPYNALKKLTRKNEKITRDTMARFIRELDVKDEVREELLAISPFNYTGI
jgi:adenylosuccinate lyase